MLQRRLQLPDLYCAMNVLDLLVVASNQGVQANDEGLFPE